LVGLGDITLSVASEGALPSLAGLTARLRRAVERTRAVLTAAGRS
jgi:hypothetical protein